MAQMICRLSELRLLLALKNSGAIGNRSRITLPFRAFCTPSAEDGGAQAVEVSTAGTSENVSLREPENGKKEKKSTGRSRFYKEQANRLVNIMCRSYWSPGLEKRMKIAVPILNREIVVNVLRKAKTAKQAQLFFKWTLKNRYRPDRNTCYRMLEILRQADRIEDARALLFQVRKMNIKWRDDMFSSVIKGYGEIGQLDEALKIFHIMKVNGVKPSLFTYNRLIRVLVFNKGIFLAKKHFKIMVSEGIKPDLFTFNLIISGSCLHKKMGTARKFLKMMVEEYNIQPTAFTYNSLIDGYFRCGKVDHVLTVLDEMKERRVKRNKVTYTLLINNYIRKGMYDEAEGYFSEMLSNGVKPDDLTYKTMISIYCEAKNVSRAHELLFDMLDRGIRGSVSLFNKVIKGHCRETNMVEALKVFDRMVELRYQPDFVTYKNLIKSLFGTGNGEKAVELLEELLRNIALPDPKVTVPEFDSFFTVLHHLCEEGQTQKSESLFREMLKKGVKDTSVFNAIIRGHCKEGNPQAGFDILTIMLKRNVASDIETYAALIESFLSKKDPADAKYVLDKMLESGLKPSPQLFGSVMEGLFSDGRIQTASRVMKSMLENDIKENLDLVPKILQALLDRGHVEEFVARLTLTLEKKCAPDVNGILMDLCENNNSTAARRLLQFAVPKGFSIDPKAIETVLTALCNEGKHKETILLVHTLQNKGLRPSNICSENLVTILRKQRKSIQARILGRELLGPDGTQQNTEKKTCKTL